MDKDEGYTLTPIPGRPVARLLPDGCALVLEGGGLRGFYTSGVFEPLMRQGIMFPYVIGVSAGAANGLTYISGQPERSRQVVANYVGSPRYVGVGNLLRIHSMFDYDYAFHVVPQRHVFFDWDSFYACPARFLTGAMDCDTGRTVWFEKTDCNPDFVASIASCSMPLVSRIVSFKGHRLLDGGVSDPIPIERSLADGNRFHVIVLTRNPGYVKEPFRLMAWARAAYREYPEVVAALGRRHEVYNRQLALCEQLEREGKAIIIRPRQPLAVGRVKADTAKLLALYDEGEREGAQAIPAILDHVRRLEDGKGGQS